MFTPAFLLLCVLFHVQAILNPIPNHGALKGYCIETKNCDPGDCCVEFNEHNEKDLIEFLRRFVKGKCEPYGRTEAVCRLLSQGGVPLYQRRCPCNKGLRCTSVGNGGLGRCRVPVCRTNTDCRRNECCVRTRPRGKRAVSHPGICQMLGTKGSNCMVSNQVYPPKPIVFVSCPCRTPYSCIGRDVWGFGAGLGTCFVRRG